MIRQFMQGCASLQGRCKADNTSSLNWARHDCRKVPVATFKPLLDHAAVLAAVRKDNPTKQTDLTQRQYALGVLKEVLQDTMPHVCSDIYA
jgi:hypothetical protein